VDAKLCLERPIWPRLPKKGVTQWWGRPAATPLALQDFVVDLRERLRATRRELDGADPRTHAQKLAPVFAGYLCMTSCMDGLASQTKHCTGPSPFAA